MTRFLLAIFILSLGACSGTIVPELSGSDQEAGTVEFSYTHAPGAAPDIDWSTAEIAAGGRCLEMGYVTARRTGDLERSCRAGPGRGSVSSGILVGRSRGSAIPQTQRIGLSGSSSDCDEIDYTVTYQCEN
ncbi:MAG: hypothetical protein H7A04_15415 [Pseudomonadales bacterium]|nr:hypothetical protein [Pseudomonadales bacterium]